MGTTKKELIEDLRKKPFTLKREFIMNRARKGIYHDFDTPLAAPKTELVHDLRAAGYDDLARAAMEGAYDDESPTAAQLEEMRSELGAEFFDAVMAEGARKKEQ